MLSKLVVLRVEKRIPALGILDWRYKAPFESRNSHQREATAKARLVTAKKQGAEQLKAPARTKIVFTGVAEAA